MFITVPSVEYVRRTDVSPILVVFNTVDNYVGFYELFNLCFLPSVEYVRGTDVSPVLVVFLGVCVSTETKGKYMLMHNKAKS
jgi:hypothetical protein